MSTKIDNENTSPDTENRNTTADTTPSSSSACTESRNMSADTTGTSSACTENAHLFPETESKDASTETTIDNPSVNTDSTDTPDTLTLARLDRENQGTWEAEFSYGGEVDLHRHFDSCTKNPGHKNFIPVDEFSIEHLPEEYRDKDVMDYIRAESDLTVRVTVKYVSNKRPETDGVSGKPFPGYSYRGRWRTTVGTGWVENVYVERGNEHETCRCKYCVISPKPKKKFGRIYIHTASHVVYDEKEAGRTTCHLYFDRGGTPETCEDFIALKGMSYEFNNTDIDGYCMSHYTHDLDLAHRLSQRCTQRHDLTSKLKTKSRYNWNLKLSLPAPEKQPLLFIVSHPHGCSKQISIGRCHSVFPQHNNQWGYTYTTATCPGSSGAGVHVINKCVQRDWQFRLTVIPPVHRGVCDKQPGINLSLFYQESLLPKMVSPKLLLRYEEGLWKDICYVEDEDLRKHYDTCQNNPGHQNFFPVDKFSVDHLPPCECKDEIMELIKVLSHLTVRMSVRYVSEQRQETVPGTDIPDPWYSHRGSNQLRLGSGRITKVEFPDDEIDCESEYEECKNSDTSRDDEVDSEFEFDESKSSDAYESDSESENEIYKYLHTSTDDEACEYVEFENYGTPKDVEICECEECKNSATPAVRKFARIYIRTASHLVYDKLEGEKTTCHLFFDSGETPDACKDVVTLTNAYRTDSAIDEDSCTLKYCTHDLDLAYKLTTFMRLYKNSKRQCYSSYNHETVKQNDRKNLTPNPPLNIVVSHPHGRAKHVSISFSGCHGNHDTEEIQRPYKSITCPGSSGAPLIALGPQTLYPCFE